MLICAVSRAPLVPIGSLSTCTMSAWPSKIWRSMGNTGSGVSTRALPPFDAGGVDTSLAGTAWLRSRGAACLAAMLGMRSATCRNAARSRPMSMKADCMPGNTRETLPR
ncbi:hypothetical protein D9M68_824930 [compost metagenome]